LASAVTTVGVARDILEDQVETPAPMFRVIACDRLLHALRDDEPGPLVILRGPVGDVQLRR
jgi:hypothetical protein